jgi:hypothetical protein
MTNDFGMTAILLLFLAAAIERTVEVLIAPFDQASVAFKRGVAIGLSLAIGAGLAFGLQLDLVGPLTGAAGLTAMQGRAATAIALAGGSAPIHELIRLLEEAKTRLKAGSS